MVSPNYNKQNQTQLSISDVTKLFDQSPPTAPEAEAALLGSMILDFTVIGDVVERISGPDDFPGQKHATLYRVLVDMYSENTPIDMVQLKQRLADMDILEEIGDVAYLIDLAESVPSATSAAYYAKIVADKAVIRRLAQVSGTTLYEAFHLGSGSVEDLIDKAESAILSLRHNENGSKIASIMEMLQKACEYTQLVASGQVQSVNTGFFDLDQLLTGLYANDMIVVAGRPGMGKSTFVLCAFLKMAKAGIPVGVISLEMSREQVGMRLLSLESDVPLQNIRRGNYSLEDLENMKQAQATVAHMPFYLEYAPGCTILQAKAKARRMIKKYNIKVLAIDYIQLMNSGSRADSREQEVAEISRQTKALAGELNIPVIAVCQLNRENTKRTDKRPRISDLRESGSIEQDADVIMLLHREDEYHKGEDPNEYYPTNEAELIVAKQRMGPAGVVKLLFIPHIASFENYAHSGSSAAYASSGSTNTKHQAGW